MTEISTDKFYQEDTHWHTDGHKYIFYCNCGGAEGEIDNYVSLKLAMTLAIV